MTTTTTKYELTNADRERLDVIAQRAKGNPKVDDTAWKIVRDWFASLPVVSREAAERALGEVTDEELERFDNQLVLHRGDGAEDDWRESLRLALSDFVAHRDMLDDDAPEPQPAIDVVAELAELRKNADRCLATLGAHRSQIDDAIATIGLMLESQDTQRGVLKIHAERLDTLNLRVTDLEFVAQRKPWWRRW